MVSHHHGGSRGVGAGLSTFNYPNTARNVAERRTTMIEVLASKPG
jgi:hypothetical protein